MVGSAPRGFPQSWRWDLEWLRLKYTHQYTEVESLVDSSKRDKQVHTLKKLMLCITVATWQQLAEESSDALEARGQEYKRELAKQDQHDATRDPIVLERNALKAFLAARTRGSASAELKELSEELSQAFLAYTTPSTREYDSLVARIPLAHRAPVPPPRLGFRLPRDVRLTVPGGFPRGWEWSISWLYNHYVTNYPEWNSAISSHGNGYKAAITERWKTLRCLELITWQIAPALKKDEIESHISECNHGLDRRNTSDAVRKPYREVRNALKSYLAKGGQAAKFLTDTEELLCDPGTLRTYLEHQGILEPGTTAHSLGVSQHRREPEAGTIRKCQIYGFSRWL